MRGDDLDDTAKHEVVVSFIAEAANKKLTRPQSSADRSVSAMIQLAFVFHIGIRDRNNFGLQPVAVRASDKAAVAVCKIKSQDGFTLIGSGGISDHNQSQINMPLVKQRQRQQQ